MKELCRKKIGVKISLMILIETPLIVFDVIFNDVTVVVAADVVSIFVAAVVNHFGSLKKKSAI
jgi:hypothetical protein